ncbi:MAG: ATP-binding protein [Bacteroidia bacterium]
MLAQVKEKKRILPRHLRELIDGGENEVLDFKKEITSTTKIAKTIVSFANHKGGIILVGVNDDKTIYGINSEEEKHMLTTAADFFCKPTLSLEIKEHVLGKKTILEAVIPKGTEQPYFAKGEDEKWWAYIRVKDQSLLASKVVLDVLRRANNEEQTLIKYSSKEQALLDYLNKNERITLKEYCKLLNISRRSAQTILVNLISIGMIKVHTTEKADFYTLS